ncbi:MAG: plastocyanin/azurin family copper-binding protein, partial [Bradymonadaceae bacterium]
DVVRWKFDDRTPHTTTNGQGSSDPNSGQIWDSGSKRNGATYCVKFKLADSYPYFCKNHGAATMSGTVKVE